MSDPDDKGPDRPGDSAAPGDFSTSGSPEPAAPVQREDLQLEIDTSTRLVDLVAPMGRGQRALVLDRIPGFYRDEHKDHWGRLALDATWPWGRAQEFERKRIPGEDSVDLAQYIKR